MEKRIENLRDLLIDEGRELYDATEQELKELPKMERSANSPGLKKLIKKQMAATEAQQKEIREAFNKLDTTLEAEKCETTQAILERSRHRINQSADKEVSDAAIIHSMQQLGHRKIFGFGSTAAYAKQIGHKDAAKSFHKALERERKMDEELTKLAEKEVNYKAAAVMM